MSMSDKSFLNLINNSDIKDINKIRGILNEYFNKNLIKRTDFVRYSQLLNYKYINKPIYKKEKSVFQFFKEVWESATNAKYN